MNVIQPFQPGREPSPMPAWFVPLVLAVWTFTFYMQRTVLNISATLPVVLFLSLSTYRYTTGDAGADFTLGSWAVILPLRYLDRVLSSDENEREYIGRSVMIKQPKSTSNGNTSGTFIRPNANSGRNSRVLNSLSLFFNLRGIGWKWQVKGVEPFNEPLPSRRLMVLRKGIMGLIQFAVTDVLGSLLAATSDWRIWNLSPLQKVLFDISSAWLCGLWMAFGLLGIYNVAAAATLVIRLTEPWQWPDFYGDWFQCYRLRKFWGITYHQLFRRSCQSPTMWLCRALRFEKRSLMSRYIQLYGVFLLSGVAHMAGSYNVTRSISAALSCGDLENFLLQAVLITIEDFIVWIWLDVFGMRSRLGASTAIRAEKCFGYVWTIGCITWSLSTFMRAAQTQTVMQMKYGSRNASWNLVKKMVDKLKPE